MLRSLAAVAALVLSAAAFSQTTSSQQVQLLAPQLVAFSGSGGNFESLVNGLTQGTPVTLTTVTSDGILQIVTFVPGVSLSAVDAARVLETARQNLITRGVAAPNAQQLAVALIGGSLQTASGISPLTGALTGTAGTTPLQVRNELATGSALASGTTSNLSTANLLALGTALAQGSAVTLTSTTSTGASQAVTFTPTGRAMSAFEVNQALQLANALLAQQGIVNPTLDQLRVALLGGTLVGANGIGIPVQGVLQGRLRATSDSPLVGTSNSPLSGTSNSPVVGTSNTPAAVNPAAAGTVVVRRVPAMAIRPGG